jgi:two-component system OmpR family response regulator
VRILVVEDESSLSHQLVRAMSDAGYAADCAPDGERADFLVRTESYDAIILDLGLPMIDGLTLLRRWRESAITVPVLILSARGNWHERVEGIDSGADDYVVKPFTMEEVLARIRALIRRATGNAQAVLTCGDVTLDPRTAVVTRKGLPVTVTSHEFRLLSYLMHNHERVVPFGELGEHLYAQGFERGSNTIEVFIARLRRKLGPRTIQTVRGIGYRLVP